MKRILVALPLLALGLGLGATAGAAAPAKSIRLFDGRTLKGWEGEAGAFSVRDGAIMAGTMKAAIAKKQFLCTTARYGDFALKARFKLRGATVNSGIQFRTELRDGFNEVSGYQADLGQEYWGTIYDEGRRNKTIANVDQALVRPHIRFGDWNTYEITARGPHITVRLNGFQTVDYTEAEAGIAPSGRICLQLHSGPASEVYFKDIVLDPL